MHVLNDLGKLSRGNHVPPSVVGLRVVNLCDSRVKLKVTLDVGSPSYNVFLLHGLREHSGRSTGKFWSLSTYKCLLTDLHASRVYNILSPDLPLE